MNFFLFNQLDLIFLPWLSLNTRFTPINNEVMAQYMAVEVRITLLPQFAGVSKLKYKWWRQIAKLDKNCVQTNPFRHVVLNDLGETALDAVVITK